MVKKFQKQFQKHFRKQAMSLCEDGVPAHLKILTLSELEFYPSAWVKKWTTYKYFNCRNFHLRANKEKTDQRKKLTEKKGPKVCDEKLQTKERKTGKVFYWEHMYAGNSPLLLSHFLNYFLLQLLPYFHKW